MLGWMVTASPGSVWTLPWFAALFFVLGAVGNCSAIAYIGYLMEISPQDRRPAYSGYFNALIAPAALLPIVGAGIAAAFSFATVFAASLTAALLQVIALFWLVTKENDRPSGWLQWQLAKLRYRRHGLRLEGKPSDQVWYFAFGANMHESAFCERRAMAPSEWRAGRIGGYRLRFNLEGRPVGKAAPANIAPDRDAEVWGVLYRISRADLVRLDWSEGVPGPRYRHLSVEAEDINGTLVRAVTYVADGKEVDGTPSLRYLTLIREGARAHGLPDHWQEFLNNVGHAR